MPDVFISYSAKDEELAQVIHGHLQLQKLEVFMASISLNHGEHWTPQIIEALRKSEWVFLLASKNALMSPNVQQEMGGAIFGKKKLVPIMWDVDPTDLPKWIADFQGLALNGSTMEQINLRVSALAEKVRASKINGQVVAGIVVAALFFLASKG